MVDRVVVFIDYQNVYRSARRVFHRHEADEHWCGQVDPLQLALWLAADSPFDRELTEVRLYRGLPSNDRDPKGYGAARRQIDAWESDPRVVVRDRPLRYPDGWPQAHQPGEMPREKGIDVSLAMDFAVLGLRGHFDVGILFSLDTDLRPALEFVSELTEQQGKPRAEVAAWSAKDQRNGRLSIPGKRIYCHWIGEDVYKNVRDNRNYARSS